MAGTRVALNNDEVKFLAKRMKAGRTWAQAKSDLAVIYPDIDTTGIDAGFEIGVTTRAQKEAREFTPGPEAELEVLRTLVPPTITALGAPSAAKGSELRILGTGFVLDAEVTVCTKAATVVSRQLTEIVVLVPTNATVDVAGDVVVTNRNGLASTLAGAFTPLAP